MASSLTLASCGDETVLLNTFVQSKKRYRVLFYGGEVVWESEKSKNDKTTVPICDIIAVQLVRPKCKAKPTEKSNRSQSGNAEKRETFEKSSDNTINSEDDDKTYETIEIEVDASDPIAFTLHYATRRYGGNRWRVQKRTFHSPDARIVRLWYDTIRQTLADDPGRPRHILLFINPYGGKQQATQIYDKHARPLFELAKVAVTVIVSQRANHIRDTIIKHGGLEQYDGIACIGGDGTFSEVFNGLVLRGILDLGLDPASIFEMSIDIPRPNIPIGIIPGGSTDTVAYCLHGTTDVRTACIHICLGQRTGLDLSSVSNANGLVRLYASVMSYGYLGDVAVDSEKFRWMGPKRYDYSGFKKFMANRCYEGEILIQQRDASVTDPADGFECFENCRRCTEARARKETGPTERSVIMMDEADAGQGNLGYVEDASGTAAVATCSPWKIVRGKFFMVNGANLSCACSRSPNGFSKFCHVGDGCVDLVVIRQTSFFNNLRLLMKLSGSKSQIAELPFVEIYRVRKFQFRTPAAAQNDTAFLPNGSQQPIRLVSREYSQWNCDGEVIHGADITVRSHCQLVTVFRRGMAAPPLENAGKSSSCGFCGF